MSGIRNVARVAMLFFCCTALKPRTDEGENKDVDENVLG
jgi:hypothetical protein